MRRTNQLAGDVVSPAVQRADDVAVSPVAQRAAALQQEGLPVPADIGDQLNARGIAHQRPALAFVGQRVIVTQLGHRQLMAQVARAFGKQLLLLAGVQTGVKIAGDGQLAGRLQESKA